jgi:hypothetical protein
MTRSGRRGEREGGAVKWEKGHESRRRAPDLGGMPAWQQSAAGTRGGQVEVDGSGGPKPSEVMEQVGDAYRRRAKQCYRIRGDKEVRKLRDQSRSFAASIVF